MEIVLPRRDRRSRLESNHADQAHKDHGSSAEFIDDKRANSRKDEIDCGGANVDTE